MPTLVIVGAQWGDEAKGKIVDVLGSQAEWVVRYSGGNNAGHTVITGGKTFKFHLLPAGILHQDVVSVLASGMAICPQALVEEIDRTREQQADLGPLKISAAAHVVMPYHRMIDRLEEEARGADKIGTTSRGIGPCYTDKVQRSGIRMHDFVRPERLKLRLEQVLTAKNPLLELSGEEREDPREIYEQYAPIAERLAPYVEETDTQLQEAVESGKKVLFEGAQGTFLDLDHGTYPYVTSSHPIAGGACLGTGVGPRSIDHALGVCKAYTTRVGSGPFPTELTDATADQIRTQGHEFGTTTGRPRRCGWLDLVALRYSRRVNSLSGWVLTRLDVLKEIPELKVAVGYEGNEGAFPGMPITVEDWQEVRPRYETLEGWSEDISGCRRYEDLPDTTKRYIQLVEEFTGVPAAILSIGPDREQTIIRRPDLIWG